MKPFIFAALCAALFTPAADAQVTPETICGIEKPALEEVQGPRLPGQILYPTWPPVGVHC